MAARKKPGDRGLAVSLAGHRRIATARGEWVRQVITHEDGSRADTVRMFDGDTLSMMYERKMITAEQWSWGKRLREDCEAASRIASGMPDVSRPQVDRTPDYNAAMVMKLDSTQRYALALKAVGMVHSAALCAVVIDNEPLVKYGQRRFGIGDERGARQAARGVVCAALDELGEYYRKGTTPGQRTRQDARNGGRQGNDT